MECVISHYTQANESKVTTPIMIAKRLQTLVPLTLPFVADIKIGRKLFDLCLHATNTYVHGHIF